MGAMASLITSIATVRTQQLVQAQIKENIETPRHWSLGREFTDDRLIPCTDDQ